MIPNVRRAIPRGILPGPSGVVEVIVIVVVCERRLICATRQGSVGQEPRVADVAIATFAAEGAELDGVSVGLLSSKAQRAIDVQQRQMIVTRLPA